MENDMSVKKKTKCELCGGVEIGFTRLVQAAGVTRCENRTDCKGRQDGKWQDYQGSWHDF